MSQYFRAPWGLKLKLVTAAYAILCTWMLVSGGLATGIGLLVIGAVALVFGVRGYNVGDGELKIHHLGWAETFDLRDLIEAEVIPGGMPGSLRVSGVGGLFSFVGRFWHPNVGWYRAYATDGSRSVLLSFGDQTVLVTPVSPGEFAAAVRFQRYAQPAS